MAELTSSGSEIMYFRALQPTRVFREISGKHQVALYTPCASALNCDAL
jgi:hypothetical protein